MYIYYVLFPLNKIGQKKIYIFQIDYETILSAISETIVKRNKINESTNDCTSSRPVAFLCVKRGFL